MKSLAESATVWKVVLESAYIDDEETKQKIITGLAEILDMEESDVAKGFAKKNYWYELKGKVETDVKDEINQFKADNNIGNGIRLVQDYKRYYPYGEFASSV